MKYKQRCLGLLFIALLFSSCFNNLKISKDASVSFSLDEAAVKQIVDSARKVPAYSKIFSSRAAEEEEAETSQLFIDVTLCADVDQTKSLPLTKEVRVEFDKIPVNTKVYAKAEVYAYTDSSQSQKEVFYRGQSKTITVRDTSNALTIKMAAALLTVTFETNGGSELAPVTVKTGEPVEEPEKPLKPAGKKKYSRENFAFAGWYTDAELTQAYNFALPVKNDLTLYAKWLPDFVFVEGATVENYLAAGRNVKISDLFVSDHEVTQKEYEAVMAVNPSANKTYNDLPVENVTWFDAIEYCNKLSKKEGLNPCYTINGDNVSCSLSANGYRLPTEAEWEYIAGKALRTNTDFSNIAYTAANSGNKTHPVKYSLADELSLCDIFGNVAEWCYDIYSASIANSTGPTGPMASGSVSRVVRGGSYQSDQEDCTSQTRSYASPTNRDSATGFRLVRTVVYEYKVIKNTVTFNSNGGSAVSAQLVVDGDTAQVPAEPVKTGYIFQGWQLAGSDFDFSTPVTQDIILEAQWEAITYKVLFNYNPIDSQGSGTVNEYNATYDQIIELPEISTITPPTGYHFKIWSLEADAETLTYDTSNPQIKNLVSVNNGSITLYAIWEENDKHYVHYQNIDFDNVDVSGLKEYFKEADTVASTDIAAPSGIRTGYTFSGWYYSDASGNATSTQFAGWAAGEKTENVYLYAQWAPITYTVRFLSNNSNATGSMSDQTITYDTATELTESNYTLTGYDFAGWNSSNTATVAEYSDKQSVENLASTQGAVVTLYAIWTPRVYKVVYNLDGGSLGGTHEYDSDNAKYYDEFTFETPDFDLPTTVTKEGAVFDGWYTSTDFTEANKITKIEQGSYYDKEVYAKWNYQRTISVTIVSGDWSSTGSGGTEFTVTNGGSALSEGDTVTGTSITLTATALTGYSYTWEIDGNTINPQTSEAYSSTNTLTIADVSGWYWPNGIYDVVVSATNGTAYESFYLQIKVN